EFAGKENWDNSPLHIAVGAQRLDIIDLLLEQGADINAKNREGYTPIYKIPWKQTEGFDLFKFLQQRGADLQAKTNSNISLAHYAALQENIPILKYLFEKGLDVNQQNDYGETPLHWTVNYDCFKSAQFLLNYGAAINVQNWNGRTVLHEASIREYQKLIKLFLEFGADRELTDQEGKKARDLAQKEKTILLLNEEIVQRNDPELNSLIQTFSIDQKELFDSIRNEIRERLQNEFSQIDRKNLIDCVSKPLLDLKPKWERLHPEALVIIFEWAGSAQMPFSGYAFPRGYTQFKMIPDSIVFQEEIPFGDPVFEEYEVGIDFSDAFEGIKEILDLTDRNEYWIVKNLYNSFLAFLLKETFSQIFKSDSFWFLFGVEHDQKPFLLFRSN
ncbi:ankyrin repeat protein, partial [Leptospira weilii str. Ecochallenge]